MLSVTAWKVKVFSYFTVLLLVSMKYICFVQQFMWEFLFKLLFPCHISWSTLLKCFTSCNKLWIIKRLSCMIHSHSVCVKTLYPSWYLIISLFCFLEQQSHGAYVLTCQWLAELLPVSLRTKRIPLCLLGTITLFSLSTIQRLSIQQIFPPSSTPTQSVKPAWHNNKWMSWIYKYMYPFIVQDI